MKNYLVPNSEDPNRYVEVPIHNILREVLKETIQKDLLEYFPPLSKTRPGDFYYLMFPKEGSLERTRWYEKRDLIDLIKSGEFQARMPEIVEMLNKKLPGIETSSRGMGHSPAHLGDHNSYGRGGHKDSREIKPEELFKLHLVQNLDGINHGFTIGGFNIRSFLLSKSNSKLHMYISEIGDKFWGLYFWSLLSQSAYNQYFSKQKNFGDILIKLLSVRRPDMPEYELFSKYLIERAYEVQKKHLNFYGEAHLTPSVDVIPTLKKVLDDIVRQHEFKSRRARYEIPTNYTFSPWGKVYFFPDGKS